MPLASVSLPEITAEPPGDVRSFLREAERRIENFRRDRNVPGFVPSDHVRVYQGLRAIVEADLAPGNLFCEWGSGFGVVACLATMLDFDACGIEIEPELVRAARRLADDFDLPAQFIRGSFLPPGEEALAQASAYAWLSTEAGASDELELAPDDFDVIFAFPWPDEEQFVAGLFERHARPGALLVTYHDGDDLRLRRKRGR